MTENELQFYPMKQVRCIIFANSTYTEANKERRALKKKLIKELKGVAVDAKNLRDFFTSLRYSVKLYENYNRSKTETALTNGKYSNNDN